MNLRISLVKPIATVMVGLALLDAAITDLLIRNGTAHEANPVMVRIFSLLTMEGALGLTRVLIPVLFAGLLIWLVKTYPVAIIVNICLSTLLAIVLVWGFFVAQNCALL